VFVEKPLAVTPEQLAQVRDTIQETGNDRLMVGFNRRFATVLNDLRGRWGVTGGPQVVHYTVNAGPLDAGSWYGQTDLQGTRFVGEGGHFIDTVSWWLGADPVEAHAIATPDDPDNLIATLTYADGSIAKLAYVTHGDPKYPKETLEVFADGKVARMDNFRRTEVWRGGKCKKVRAGGIDKGQKQELEAFVAAVKAGGEMPVPVASLIATTAATFAVSRSIATRRPERLAEWSRWDAEEIEAHAPSLSGAGAAR
jgi:predicted dehydrogenase